MATVHPSRLGLISEDLRPQQDPSNRRASPQYDDYRSRPQRMYPERGAGGRHGGGGGHYEGNAGWLDSRREQRETIQVDVWPPSPRAPFKELHQKHHKSSRKSKRHRSPSTDSTSPSEDERRRKAHKDKRRRSKHSRDRDYDRKRRHHSRSRHRSYSDDSDSDTQHRSKKVHRSRERRSASLHSRAKSEARLESRSPLPDQHEDDDEWVVKKPSTPPTATKELSHSAAARDVDSDSGSELGPQPLFKTTTTKKLDERAYGGALLRGEGSAMAAFLQDGTDLRIPRRGEIGLTSDEIAQFENVGYVMSGSRHRRMNAVRMRKENQVISAEEKRGILKLQREERERRESILREEFSELVSEKLKASATQMPGPSKE